MPSGPLIQILTGLNSNDLLSLVNYVPISILFFTYDTVHLSHKGNIYTPGIGLLEVFWKVMEAVIDTCIKKAVTFHDASMDFARGW